MRNLRHVFLVAVGCVCLMALIFQGTVSSQAAATKTPMPTTNSSNTLAVSLISYKNIEKTAIYRLETATGVISKVIDYSQPPDLIDKNASVSPDGKQIAWIETKIINLYRQYPEIFAADITSKKIRQVTNFKTLNAKTNTAKDGRITTIFGPVSWSPDGKQIVFQSRTDISANPGLSTLSVINADGSNLHDLLKGGVPPNSPVWSPDGKTIAYVKNDQDGTFYKDRGGDIYIVDRDGKQERRLTTDPHKADYPQWLPDGRLLYTLRLDNSMTEVHVFDTVSGSDQKWFGQEDLGYIDGLVAPSPDGKLLAYGTYDSFGIHQIEIFNTEKKTLYNLTMSVADSMLPIWMPDGKSLLFTSDRNSDSEIYTLNLNGVDKPQRISNNPAFDSSPAWSPDGTRLAFVSIRDDNEDIYIMNKDGSHQQRLTDDPHADNQLVWSPDGQQIAYLSSQAGGSDVYVMSADGTNRRKLTTTTGTPDFLQWSSDGQALKFMIMPDPNHLETMVIRLDGTQADAKPGAEPFLPPDYCGGFESPDGTRTVYSDNNAIYICNVDRTNRKNIQDLKIGAITYEIKGSVKWLSNSQVVAMTNNAAILIVNTDGSPSQIQALSFSDPNGFVLGPTFDVSSGK